MNKIENPPDTDRKVVLWFKKNKLVSGGKVIFEDEICQTYARFIKKFTEECNCEYSGDCDCQYNEDRDDYFYPEGWYEVTEFNDQYAYYLVQVNSRQTLLGWTERPTMETEEGK